MKTVTTKLPTATSKCEILLFRFFNKKSENYLIFRIMRGPFQKIFTYKYITLYYHVDNGFSPIYFIVM